VNAFHIGISLRLIPKRKVLGINPKDRMRSEELRRRSGIEDAAKAAIRQKWRWGGHVARMDHERWAYATTVWDPRIGRRNRGNHDVDGARNLEKL
jgi:hypothetical protein